MKASIAGFQSTEAMLIDGPLPPWRMLPAILRNPLDIWTREFFDEPMIEARTILGARLAAHDPAAIGRVLVDNAQNYVRDPMQRAVLARTTGRGLFSAEGADWRRQRKAIAPFFSPRALDAYLPAMVETIMDWIARFDASATIVALDREMTELALQTLNRTLFAGCLNEPAAQVAASVRRFSQAAGSIGLADLLGLPPAIPRWRSLRAWRDFRDVRARARHLREAMGAACPAGGSLVSALAATGDDVVDGDGGGNREIEDNLSTLIGAGSDTTAHAIAWALYLTSQFAGARAQVEAEADQLPADRPIAASDLQRLVWTRAVVEEALRLFPPAPAIGRMAVGGDTLGGCDVRPGTIILMAPWVLHRHRRLWDDPDAFRPERFLPEQRAAIGRFSYLPFGAGARICPGMGFAVQQAMLVLALVAKHLHLSRADDAPIRIRQRLTLLFAQPLRMRLLRREGR